MLKIPYNLKWLLRGFLLRWMFATAKKCEALQTIAVFGGSGYIGRRVCQQLIKTHHRVDKDLDEEIRVIAISRSGRPPKYLNKELDQVEWLKADMSKDVTPSLPPLAAAISLVGNVEPVSHWQGLFGLGFDDEKLRQENGVVNERICQLAKRAGAERFVFVSVSYEVAKAWEGPIAGYLDGKRQAEFAASHAFGDDNTFVVGPSLVYGGKRFPKLGRLYRSLVESFVAKAYLKSNEALRSLSSAQLDDWLEKAIFSPPVDVHEVANVIVASALGQVNRSVVPTRRRQGFWNTLGEPVTFADVIYIDGTKEIERVSMEVGLAPLSSNEKEPRASNEPYAEGGMDNFATYMRPLPVAAFFAVAFWSVMTQQFIQTVPAIT